MNILRILARVILIFIMIPIVLRLIYASARIVIAINHQVPMDTLSFVIGEMVATLLIFIVFYAGFRMLRRKPQAPPLASR